MVALITGGRVSVLPYSVSSIDMLRGSRYRLLPSLAWKEVHIYYHSCPPFQHLLSERLTSLGIMGASRVPPLNPSETIVLSEHCRLWGV